MTIRNPIEIIRGRKLVEGLPKPEAKKPLLRIQRCQEGTGCDCHGYKDD